MFIQLGHLGNKRFADVLFTVAATILGFMIGALPSMALEENGMMPKSNTNAFLLLQLLPFIMGLFTLLICVMKIHLRHPLSLISPSLQIDWKRIFTGTLCWIVLLGFAEYFLCLLGLQSCTFRVQWMKLVGLLPIAILLVPLQSAFEELFFRGYLLQLLGSKFKSEIAGIIISAILFAALHLANPEVEQFGKVPMYAYYLFFGLFLGWITVQDDRNELAIGMHAGNNIFGVLIISHEHSVLQTAALFQVGNINFMWTFIVTLIAAGIFYYIIQAKYYLKKQNL